MNQKIVLLSLVLVLIIVVVLFVKFRESFWHGPRWFGPRWYGPRWYGRPYWNQSDDYLHCIRVNNTDPNRDEKCCQIVFGTSCQNL